MKRINNPFSKFKIKEIHKEYVDKRLTQNLIDFHKWVSSYNYINSGVALKLFLPNQDDCAYCFQIKTMPSLI